MQPIAVGRNLFRTPTAAFLCGTAACIQRRHLKSFFATSTQKSSGPIVKIKSGGYKEVPTPLIRSIFAELPAAEVILTFNVDAFITYASDTPLTAGLLQQIGIPDGETALNPNPTCCC